MEPITNEELFMAAAAGQSVKLPEPITRQEKFLKAIADFVQSGGATPEQIQTFVNEYLAENPPQAYTLPVGGDQLGGVKNGGNVTINADGTMDAPDSSENANGGTYSAYNGINMLNALIAEIEAGTTKCPDYITVAFGANTSASAIGTAEDTSETTTTVYGAMKYFIEKLRMLQATYNPQMVFGFVLPCQTNWNDTGHNVSGAREAMKAVLDSDEYTAPYVDMWKESGITADMMADGVHISDERTNNLYYRAMRRFMMGL